MGIRKRVVMKTLKSGFILAKKRNDVDQYKLDMCIKNVEKIADFVIDNQRKPSEEELNVIIGLK